jgi:hypothetical protein
VDRYINQWDISKATKKHDAAPQKQFHEALNLALLHSSHRWCSHRTSNRPRAKEEQDAWIAEQFGVHAKFYISVRGKIIIDICAQTHQPIL